MRRVFDVSWDRIDGFDQVIGRCSEPGGGWVARSNGVLFRDHLIKSTRKTHAKQTVVALCVTCAYCADSIVHLPLKFARLYRAPPIGTRSSVVCVGRLLLRDACEVDPNIRAPQYAVPLARRDLDLSLERRLIRERLINLRHVARYHACKHTLQVRELATSVVRMVIRRPLVEPIFVYFLITKTQ